MAAQTQDTDLLFTSWYFFFFGFRARVSLISQKKEAIWRWLSIGLVYTKTIIHLSVLPRRFAARQIFSTIQMHFGE